MADYKVGYKKPDPAVQFKPGNPGGPGRPPMKLFRELIKEFYAANEDKKREIIVNLDKLATSGYNSQQLAAIREILLAHDGPQASEIHLKGLIVHVGDDYALAGIEANKRDLEDRKSLIESDST